MQIEKPPLMAGEEHGLCPDKGYESPKVRELVKAMGNAPHIRSLGKEKKSGAGGRAQSAALGGRKGEWLAQPL